MQVKIVADACGELLYDLSSESVLRLIGEASRLAATETPSEMPAAVSVESGETAAKPSGKLERMFGDYRARIPVDAVLPAVPKPVPEARAYKGFLLIQCVGCRKLKGFYARTEQTTFYCECGCQTHLMDLKPLFLNCRKCGWTGKYMTNCSDLEFSYECLNCGAPTDLELNHTGKAFVTVGVRLK